MTRNEILLSQIQALENEAISYAMLSASKLKEGQSNNVEDFKTRHIVIDMMQKTDLLLYGKFEHSPIIKL